MLHHTGTVRIETERLVLRPFRETDAQSMFDNWASDPEVTRFLTWPTHQSVETTRQVIRLWTNLPSDSYNWCIALKDTDEPIGSIAVVSADGDTLEIGYCISRKHWGKGVTPEAARAVVRHLFDNVGARRVIAKHDVNNPNSGRVMQKIGMVYLETRAAENNTGPCTVNIWQTEFASSSYRADLTDSSPNGGSNP